MASGTPLPVAPHRAPSQAEHNPTGSDALPHPLGRAEDEYRGGWLCPTRADRVRLTDMSPAVRRSRLLSGLFCGIGVVVMAPWHPWLLAPFALVPPAMIGLDRRLQRSERPERLIAASLIFFATLMLAGIGMTGGIASPILPWVAIPIVTAAARFRTRVFLRGALLTVLALTIAAVLGSSARTRADPSALIAILVLLAALVAAQHPLLDAEQRWRRDAILDPLTGLLNRQGLQRRFAEVAEQARVSGRPVSLIICDLDDFKRLNDTHGHARGDAVLKDLAYLLRKQLRAFELLYRIGGEELLLILPGADHRDACEIAEHTRRVIAQATLAGLMVTASLGTSTARGDQIDFQAMFAQADRALYQAKRAGRNRVHAPQ